MGLQLNSADARKADNIASVIRETGQYLGTITRAEKLLSRNGTVGVGFSFKADDGSTANYLDVYTEKSNGEKLRGHNIVNAILCCTRIKSAEDGSITCEKWDNDARRLFTATVPGYPALMNKRIGLVLQKELQTHSTTGKDVERMNIVAAFEASTGLVATEILDGKTEPRRLDSILKMIAANPVRDSRDRVSTPPVSTPATADDEFDDIPFNHEAA
jgi:hypothetical protein